MYLPLGALGLPPPPVRGFFVPLVEERPGVLFGWGEGGGLDTEDPPTPPPAKGLTILTGSLIFSIL